MKIIFIGFDHKMAQATAGIRSIHDKHDATIELYTLQIEDTCGYYAGMYMAVNAVSGNAPRSALL